MLATTVLAPLNAVLLTMTSPGFVVPVRKNCAFAPFLKPEPEIVTSRLNVPGAAAAGLAAVTLTRANREGAVANKNRMVIVANIHSHVRFIGSSSGIQSLGLIRAYRS